MKGTNIFFFLLLASNVSAEEKINNLVKIHYHQKALEDRLVCLFTKDQVCNVIPERLPEMQDYQQVSFFLPLAKISSNDVMAVLKRIESQENKAYSIKMYEVKTPINGIKVQITYNKNKIGLKQEQFDAINTHKGIVFVFYHKDALNSLKLKTDAILHYVHNNHQKPRIVIDCGHGGHDNGKVAINGIKEKDITLTIGNKVSSLLSSRGYQVVPTRKADAFIGLDERTMFANKAQADIFVSIHANGAVKDSISGIETYCFNSKLLKTNSFFFDQQLEQSIAKVNKLRDTKSKLLAETVHEHLINQIKQNQPMVVDRSVKQAVAQVLLGTNMPAILIELGFLSNKMECELLNDAKYQALLSQGICQGIDRFFDLLKKQC